MYSATWPKPLEKIFPSTTIKSKKKKKKKKNSKIILSLESKKIGWKALKNFFRDVKNHLDVLSFCVYMKREQRHDSAIRSMVRGHLQEPTMGCRWHETTREEMTRAASINDSVKNANSSPFHSFLWQIVRGLLSPLLSEPFVPAECHSRSINYRPSYRFDG